MSLRAAAKRPTYRGMDKTEEFAESQYYKVQAEGQSPGLVPNSPFWADLAAHRAAAADPDKGFVSPHFTLCTSNLTSMLVALAVLDLPFEMPKASDVRATAGKIHYGATESPLVLFNKDVSEAEAPTGSTILVGQQYFDPEDPHRREGGELVDKYLDGSELLRNKKYGSRIVATNVSRRRQQLDVLMQIPQGAVPVSNGFVTKTWSITLGSYQTQTRDYFFYFPTTGQFDHYPVHAASQEKLVAFASPQRVNVVLVPTQVDTRSWEFVANEGTLEEVIEFLRTENIYDGVDVRQCAWRCSNKRAYEAIVGALRERCFFSKDVCGYAFKHGDIRGIRDYLSQSSAALSTMRQLAEPILRSNLLRVSFEEGVGDSSADPGGLATAMMQTRDPRNTNVYTHFEYAPLVNARAHRLGTQQRITNRDLKNQYQRFLRLLGYQVLGTGAATAHQLLALTYFFVLQDRIEEAHATFAKVPAPEGSIAGGAAGAASSGAAGGGSGAASSSWSVLQYDYMAAYLDFYHLDGEHPLETARRVAEAYKSHPVPRWRAKFVEMASQLQEAATAGGGAAKKGFAEGERDEDEGKELVREKQQAAMAKTEPVLEMEVGRGADGKAEARLTTANVDGVQLSVYGMDVELLFSTSPFASAGGDSRKFSYVRPNAVLRVDTPAAPGAEHKTQEKTVPLPLDAAGSNVLVEAVAGGKRRTATFFSNSMRVSVQEAFGRVKVVEASTGRPLPRVYVKAFGTASASGAADDAFFFKDGYTDLRGVFDYSSVNTDALDRVKRFALLVMSDKFGAVVREAGAPAR